MRSTKKLYISGILLIVIPLIWEFIYIGSQLAGMNKIEISRLEFRWAFIAIYAQILGFVLTMFAKGIEKERRNRPGSSEK
jgi:hypothetical protein